MDPLKIKDNSFNVAEILKTMAHPKRLLILCFLCKNSHTVQELEELCGIGQSQLSQFLKRMEREGHISSEKDGRFVKYSIVNEKIQRLVESLAEIFCAS